jgi:pimeloyl-[acyl-carrier protein] synthase
VAVSWRVTQSAVIEPNDKNLSLLRILSPEIKRDPHQLYRVLRDYDPVHWDPYMHAWVVTTYAEVITVLTECSADRTPPPAYLNELGLSFMKPFSEIMLKQMMFMDGAMHSRLRSICAAAFTPRRVESLRGAIAETAGELIDNVIERGSVDMVADFANPLPAIVTARLLGVPREDHRQLHAWVLDLAEVLGNFQHHPKRVVEIVKSLQELKSYVAAVMDDQRKQPTGGLICSLMEAEVNGQRLSDEEVIANTIITLIGGHETTTNLIASGFLTLLRNQSAYDQLKIHPEIAASAVEELLRWESPVQHTARIASADMELGSKTIPKGAKVVAVLAAANRDPRRFSEPETLNLIRTDNRHVAFGWAAHFCFGTPLARIEGQIAFNMLIERLQNPILLEDKLEWRENAGLRGLARLNIGFTPTPAKMRFVQGG